MYGTSNLLFGPKKRPFKKVAGKAEAVAYLERVRTRAEAGQFDEYLSSLTGDRQKARKSAKAARNGQSVKAQAQATATEK